MTVLVFSVRLNAQTPDTETIRGTIVDPSHAAVSGAEITLLNRATSVKRTIETDAAGHFFTGGLPVGDYEVTTQKQGVAVATSELVLIGGITARVDVQLSPAAENTESPLPELQARGAQRYAATRRSARRFSDYRSPSA